MRSIRLIGPALVLAIGFTAGACGSGGADVPRIEFFDLTVELDEGRMALPTSPEPGPDVSPSAVIDTADVGTWEGCDFELLPTDDAVDLRNLVRTRAGVAGFRLVTSEGAAVGWLSHVGAPETFVGPAMYVTFDGDRGTLVGAAATLGDGVGLCEAAESAFGGTG
jgi:hypothetical protein